MHFHIPSQEQQHLSFFYEVQAFVEAYVDHEKKALVCQNKDLEEKNV